MEELENGDIIYNIYDYPYKDLALRCETLRKKNLTYISRWMTYDIECSTIEVSEGEYTAFTYLHSVCFFGHVCMFRTWEDFNYFFKKISEYLDLDKNKTLVVYVHFLSYEYQFMRDFLYINTLFAKDAHKPLYFRGSLADKKNTFNGVLSSKDIGQFEFRCSYFLTNMSLEKLCLNTPTCTHLKMDGVEFDYKKVRHSLTKLTKKELRYAYNDVAGLDECIAYRMNYYGDNVCTIPLTSTGYVRRQMRKAYLSETRNIDLFKSLQLTLPQYKLLRKAFRGGDTHASRYYSNILIKKDGIGIMDSWDKKSSYPASMATDLYPMSPFMDFDTDDLKELLLECSHNAVVMEITLNNVSVKQSSTSPYIDVAHCTHISSDYVNDNGRVISADWLTYACTDVDFVLICNQYTFDTFELMEAYTAKKDYLPRWLVDTMLDWFDKKTQLDGVRGKEYEYSKSKNDLNAIYGMLVTDILHDEVKDNFTEWSKTKPTPEQEQKLLDKYYNSRNSFLPYQWGVWVTANARYELHLGISAVGYDHVYNDTDCVKAIGDHTDVFNDLNKKIMHKKTPYRIYSDTPDGSRKFLGVWEKEHTYTAFKTLGAKKYAYQKGDDTVYVTVSGLSKDKGKKQLTRDGIEAFNIGWQVIDSGRSTSYFNNTGQYIYSCKDYTGKECTFLTASNIAIVDAPYTLGMTKTYEALLGESAIEFLQILKKN